MGQQRLIDTFCLLSAVTIFGGELREGGAMSAEAAKTNLTEPPIQLASPYGLAMPTGYRVAVVPGALEISARLGTPDEIRNLMKVLRAGITIL
jgi:hypothetical protein